MVFAVLREWALYPYVTPAILPEREEMEEGMKGYREIGLNERQAHAINDGVYLYCQEKGRKRKSTLCPPAC